MMSARSSSCAIPVSTSSPAIRHRSCHTDITPWRFNIERWTSSWSRWLSSLWLYEKKRDAMETVPPEARKELNAQPRKCVVFVRDIRTFCPYATAMFAKDEFEAALDYLGVSPAELADFFQLNVRTVRRWAENPSEIPGPAEQALRAWVRLQRLGLAWRPDGMAIGERSPELAEQIKAHTRHAVDLDALILRVNRRGGPKAPWSVNLKAHQATLGDVEVFFYPLANGGLLPASYTRRDRPLDLQRDWPLIEDAFACIAEAVAKAGPAWAATDDVSGPFAAGAAVLGQSAQQVLDK